MDEKLERIKEHIQEHKVAYITTTVLAIYTCVIVRRFSGKTHLNEYTESGKAHLNGHTNGGKLNDRTISSSFFSKVISNGDQIVNVLEREGRGHPGYLVLHKETDVVYPSQKVAADAFDINYKHMSDHLNGRKEHVNNQHFERVKLTA